MAKEYTRRREHSRREHSKSGAMSRFLSLLVCFVMGYLLGSLWNVYQLTQWVQSKMSPEKPPVKAIAKRAPPPKPTFEFYTLLSQDKTHASTLHQAEVASTASSPVISHKSIKEASVATITNKTALAIKTAQPVKEPVNSKEAYAIQIAAFNKREDAEALKGTLVLRGFDVMISPIMQKNMTWFRVMLGPYGSLSLAQKTQVAILRNEHMKGMIRKI